MRPILTALCLIAAALVPNAPAQAGPAPWNCSGREKMSEVRWNYPTYQDALALSRTLAQYGINSRCVARSTMESLFEDQVGSALFRTNYGDFEALVFPTRQDVAEMQIIEDRRDGRYINRIFRPGPVPTTVSLDSSKPEYFFKHDNQLLIVWGDRRMANLLQAMLAPKP